MEEPNTYEFGSLESGARDFEYYCQLMMADASKLDPMPGLNPSTEINNARAIYYHRAQPWYIEARDNLPAERLAEALEQGRLAFTRAFKVEPQDVSRLYPPGK